MDHPVRGSRAQSHHFAVAGDIFADCLHSARRRTVGGHKTFLPVRDLMEKVPRNFLTAIILPRCITTRSTKFTPTFSTNW